MSFNFLKYRKIYYIFSGALILTSVYSLVFFKLNFGIDFTGGSIMEIDFKEQKIAKEEIKKSLADFNLNLSLQETDTGFILKMKDIDAQTHKNISAKLGNVDEKRFESIGPVIGRELRQKTWIFVILVTAAIVFFIAFAFRKAAWPISSWQYGLVAAAVAFFHDVLIPIGIFAFLGKFFGVEITIPIVVGLLTILGYSVHDTIVVFDRIRENLSLRRGASFEDVVNISLNQTLARSLNTSLTTLFALAAIFVAGGESLKYFSLILILGIVAGTYSSIFVASPILVSWAKRRTGERA